MRSVGLEGHQQLQQQLVVERWQQQVRGRLLLLLLQGRMSPWGKLQLLLTHHQQQRGQHQQQHLQMQLQMQAGQQ
jgi:hypothetical protein